MNASLRHKAEKSTASQTFLIQYSDKNKHGIGWIGSIASAAVLTVHVT